jgi:6-pyruvoyltetrahydropterin/6-carboxytetrahydropterin synthase
MLRLTRQVRFAINSPAAGRRDEKPSNNYAGNPSLAGLQRYYALEMTVTGNLDPQSNYLQNIKAIDELVRQQALPSLELAAADATNGGGWELCGLFQCLRDPWPGVRLEKLRLLLSPFLSLAVHDGEIPMVRLSQKFEFCAAHRLHNPALSDEENRRTFGKCNNPSGHGHNYELEVTLKGEPDDNGLLIDIPAFERIVADAVIERLDHKHLNLDVREFADLLPTVENIAAVIYRLLKPHFAEGKAKLAGVKVWETAKTWCEYSE